MPARLRILAVLLLLTASCADPGPRIERLDLQDLPAPAMFRQTATMLRRPYLLELPSRSIDGRFDLKLDDVSLGEALDAMVRLDPQFQHEERGEVMAFYPSAPADLEASPFSKRLPSFQREGGLGDVVRGLLTEAGLLDSTNLVIEMQGLRRPVKLDLKDASLREAFMEIARQGHVAFIIEPGLMNVVAIEE